MIRPVLRMGDPRLLKSSAMVSQFGTPELFSLIEDMRDTMAHLDGAGLAAPQIGVPLRVVIFGVDRNPRYPHAEAVPETILINPHLTPLADDLEEGWEGCLSVPGLRGMVPRFLEKLKDSMLALCNMNAIILMGFSIRCESGISASSALLRNCSLMVSMSRKTELDICLRD